ncbi:MAG: group I intron-associated PD-(D/E)XK endonuclease [Terriglobales bacterium]
MTTTKPTPILNRKRRGEVAEAAFLHKAASLGFRVGKTWGESDPYDFLVDTGGRVLRVQVKSAYAAGEYGGYTFHAHGNTRTDVYTSRDIDFLVAYIVPENLWYVLPVEIFARTSAAKIFPASRRRMSRFEKYREAWSLMTAPM